ncbi:MAG: hypothetical protein IH884_07835 [Myxococcales bacterium]|nr:hypothetical protein [Myxococcales bacterium]
MKRSTAQQLTDPHKAAALVYGVLGVLVIFITFAADLVPPTREDAIWQVVIGASFVVAFAVLLYWRGWWLMSAFLIVPNVWRATNYINHGLGLHIDPRALSITAVSPRPVAFVNAGLMAVIVFLLVRSAWIGFSDWRTHRRISEES